MTDAEYQKKYAKEHVDAAKDRQFEMRSRRERCRSYWYAKLVLKRDCPVFVKDCSPELIEEERVKYLKAYNSTL